MDDATNLADAPEVENSLPVDGQEPDQTELDEYGNAIEQQEAPAAQEAEPEDDSEEIEHDGKTYRVPKELRESFLMHRDYTQKTQNLASERQAFETERDQFRNVSGEEVNARANIIAIDTALKEFEQIDWRTWFAQDPQAAQGAKLDYDEFKDRRQKAVGTFTQAQQARLMQEEQATANRMQQGHAELVRDIPGWNADKARALVDFGHKTFGFSRAELGSIDDPRVIKVLNAAFELDRASKQQKAVKQVQQQQAVKPAAKVGGGSAPPKPMSDQQTAEDWIKARNRQLAKR